VEFSQFYGVIYVHPVDEILDEEGHLSMSPISELNDLRRVWKRKGTMGTFPGRVIYATTKWDTVAESEYADYDHAKDEFVKQLSDAASLGGVPPQVIHFERECESARHIVSSLRSMPSHDLRLKLDRLFESLVGIDISQLVELSKNKLTEEKAQCAVDFLSLVGVPTIIDPPLSLIAFSARP
jgi:hypothetical protein